MKIQIGLSMKEESKRIYIYTVFFILLAAVVFCYGIGKMYGFVLFPDEFGYWAHAAGLLGMDWTEVAGIHPYYSFGFAFLTAPLLFLCEDPVMLYRFVIGLNFILLLAGGKILYHILCRLLPHTARYLLVLISGVAMVYSAFIVYAQTSLPEMLLVFLYLSIVALYQDIIESGRLWKMLLLAAMIVFLYVTHMRSIGIVAAAIVMLAVLMCQKSKMLKKAFFMMGTLLVLLAAGTVIKRLYMDTVFVNAESWQINVNDYGGQIEKIIRLFSLSGILEMLVSFIGKIFYLGCATFGAFYWGMAFILKQWRQKKVSVYLFLLLSVLFTLGVTSVYTMGTDRLDGLLYGRYNEMILPVIVALGIIGMFHSTHLWKGAVTILCINSVCILILNYAIDLKGIETTNRHSIIGVAYALTLSDQSVFHFTKIAYLGGCAAALITTALVYAINKYQWRSCTLLVLTVMQLMIGYHSAFSVNYAVNEKRKDDIEMAEKVLEMCKPNQNVVYLYSDGYGYVDILQFCLRYKPVKVMIQKDKNLGHLNPKDIIVTYPEDLFLQELEKNYNSMLKSTHFNVYYNGER